MIYKTIDIKVDYEKMGVDNGGYQPTMTLYLPDNTPEIDTERKRPTVLICPGGAYGRTSDREAEPVALKFAAEDCNAIVVRYSCAPSRFPSQLLELSYAVAMVRENAEEWNIDTDKIVVAGFSAGGHLAASFGMFWNKDFVKEYFGYKGGENKPNGMILGYPVITSGEYAHRYSFELLLGEKANDAEMLELVSLEKQVSEDTPRAFIWHTNEDGSVPAENSYLLAAAMKEKGIRSEMHIFPNGWHGLSLCNDTVFGPGQYKGQFDECQAWFNMAVRWLKNL